MRRKGLRKWLEMYIVATIFVIASIHLWGFFKQTPDTPAVISDYGDYYLVYWYPLQMNVIEVVVAAFFLIKSVLLRSCLYTKIVTWLYLGASVLSLSHILFLYPFEIYINIFPLLFNLAIFGMAIVSLIRCSR